MPATVIALAITLAIFIVFAVALVFLGHKLARRRPPHSICLPQSQSFNPKFSFGTLCTSPVSPSHPASRITPYITTPRQAVLQFELEQGTFDQRSERPLQHPSNIKPLPRLPVHHANEDSSQSSIPWQSTVLLQPPTHTTRPYISLDAVLHDRIRESTLTAVPPPVYTIR